MRKQVAEEISGTKEALKKYLRKLLQAEEYLQDNQPNQQPTNHIKMNTLLELFRSSFVFKIFIGLSTFALSMVINTREINVNQKTEVTFSEKSLHQKILEIDNAYFEAYAKTIQ